MNPTLIGLIAVAGIFVGMLLLLEVGRRLGAHWLLVLAGYGMANGEARNWFHAFALILSIALYVILDFEFPRLGLIRVDAYDQVLVDVRHSMDP